LDLGISFDEVDETTVLDFVVFFPFIRYLSKVIPMRYPLKEEDLIGAVSHYKPVVNEIHMGQTLSHYGFVLHIINVL
jgi:hypothetical protein